MFNIVSIIIDIINNMQRAREPQLLYDRIISKGAKGIQEFQEYIKKLIGESIQEYQLDDKLSSEVRTIIDEEIQGIVIFFVAKTKQGITNQVHRSLLIQSLESMAFQFEEYRFIKKHFLKIAQGILKYFRDVSEKVRLTAISSMYNLLNKYSQSGLQFFHQTFEAVSTLISDDSGLVRQAATFLNQTLKTLINDAVFDQKQFDLRGFIEMLAQKFQSGNSIFKQFLLDWLMAIQEIPHFQLSFDLPLFFKQVFELLLSNNKNLRTKAQECLKKFLHVFRQILGLGGKLSSKLRIQNAQMLIEMTLIMIRQNLSSETTLHALQWLEVFTKFFSLELNLHGEPFLQPIYVGHFRDIILVIITTLSDDSQRIRRISYKINEALLIAFPVMEKDDKKLNETSLLLQKLLQQNRLAIRVEAIMKWIKLLLQQNSEKMLTQINMLIQHIVEKLCDRNATRSLFILLQGSLFIEEYFDLFVQTLLSYLFQNQNIPPEPIFKQILSLEHAQLNFMIICRRVKLFEHNQFQYRLIQCLISILITQSSIETLRTKMQSQNNNQLFNELFDCFNKNEAAVLILCFLAKQYLLICQFMKMLAHTERLTDYKFRSLMRMSNLIENSNMNHLRADLRKTPFAVKAYLSLLMALPHSKYSNLLLQRLPPQQEHLRQPNTSELQREYVRKLLSNYQQNIAKQQNNQRRKNDQF